MNQRKMRIGMSIRGHGYHPAAWRHPEVPADCTLQVEHYVRSAQTAERGKLDMIFFADGAGIRQGDNPPGALARTGRDMIELEPTMLLPALAMVTSHIGLVTTASTTYNKPYNLARRFATLDLISKGRAGWNVVASWSEHEAQNFGLETTLDYDTRYARSAEFVGVVKGLWDGWDDGALVLDKAGGRYFDETKFGQLRPHPLRQSDGELCRCRSQRKGTRAVGTRWTPIIRARKNRSHERSGSDPTPATQAAASWLRENRRVALTARRRATALPISRDAQNPPNLSLRAACAAFWVSASSCSSPGG
jgi:alkanesulfonate monooxygenase SsuD/methylene tetrahydromethanopterin reductase-like flavin-dependent oxidoreductase (luciferase family)